MASKYQTIMFSVQNRNFKMIQKIDIQPHLRTIRITIKAISFFQNHGNIFIVTPLCRLGKC